MRTLDSDKKEIEKFTMLRYLKLSVIRSVDVMIFLRYTPSKRSVLLWVEKFTTSSMIWQKC